MSSGPIDLATLGVEVDASGVVEGAARIRDLIPAAEGAEAAVEGLEAAAEAGSAAIRRQGAATAELRSRLVGLSDAAREAAASVMSENDAVNRVAAGYGNMIAQVGLAGRELEQFNALRRAGITAASLEGVQLAELAGQYRDLADATRAAETAERARTQQAGSQYNQRLNEYFGISRPIGDDKQLYPSSARDSADVFREAAEAAEEAERKVAAYAAQADRLRARISPLVGVQQQYNKEIAEAKTLLEAGALSAEDYARAVALAGQTKTARVGDLLKGAVGSGGEGDSEASAREAARLAAEYASEAEALRARLDPLVRIQQEFNAELARADRLFDAGKISANEYAQALSLADRNQADKIRKLNEPGMRSNEALDDRADRFMADLDPRISSQNKYNATMKEAKTLLDAGRISAEAYATAQVRAKQAQDDFNGRLDEMGKRAGLSGQQMFWLLANVKDFLNQVAAGGSVLTAGMQQGPMLVQILAMAQGGFSAGLKSVADVLGRIALSGWGAAAGVGAAAAAVAALEYRGDAIRSGLSRSTYGVGRRAGMTGAEIGQAANENVDYSTAFGGGAARDAAQELAKSGNIARDSFRSVLGAVKDYAYTTDQEAGPAAKELAEALDGSSGGVDKLNAKLGFLNSSTRETYLQMVASGDKTNAQKLLIDALVPSLERANERLNIFQKTWNLVKNATSGAVDALATGLDNAITGGSLEQQLATAEATLAQAQKRNAEGPKSTLRSFLDSFGAQDGGLVPESRIDVDTSEAQRNVDELRKKMADFAKSAEIARAAARSLQVDEVVRGMNPLDEQIKKVTANSSLLQQALSSLSIPNDKIKETEAAVAALVRQTQQLSIDARSGGAAFADMVKSAQEGVRTVGFTDTARQIAANNFNAEQKITDLARNPQNTMISDPAAVEAQKQKILNDPSLTNSERNLDIQNLQVQVDGYAAQVKAIREAAALGNQQAQNQATIQLATQGGAFSKAPEAVQNYIRTATAEFGRVRQDLLAGLIDHESSFREDARPIKNGKRLSSAYGYTQLLDGTADDLGVNKYDPQDNVRGGAKYLQQLLVKFGDEFTALAAYYRGPGAISKAIALPGGVANIDPTARAYALDIQRRAGSQGGQSAKDYAERTDAVSMEAKKTRELTEAERLYGNSNPQRFEEEKARINTYYDAIKVGGQQAAVSAAEFAKLNAELVRSQMSAAAVKVSNDNQFEREQLGRTTGEQKIASTLRSNRISADSPEGAALTSQMQYNEALANAKGLANDTWGSISQGIMSGASATDVAISALGRLQSKLLQMAGDELIAKLFKGLTGEGESSSSGGSGGLIGLLSKIGGSLAGGGGGGAPSSGGLDLSVGSDASWFADGGIMTDKGKAPLRNQTGGVSSTPQTAVFGEGDRPEAFVPLPDGRSIPVTMDRGGTSSAPSVSASFSATVYMNGSSGDPAIDSQHSDESARKMRETLRTLHDEFVANDMRPGGSLYQGGARRAS